MPASFPSVVPAQAAIQMPGAVWASAGKHFAPSGPTRTWAWRPNRKLHHALPLGTPRSRRAVQRLAHLAGAKTGGKRVFRSGKMDPMQRLRPAPRRTVWPAKDVRGGAAVQSQILIALEIKAPTGVSDGIAHRFALFRQCWPKASPPRITPPAPPATGRIQSLPGLPPPGLWRVTRTTTGNAPRQFEARRRFSSMAPPVGFEPTT